MSETERTPRQRIRDWWTARRELDTPIDLVVDAGKCALTLRQDPAFCEAFLDAFLKPVIYEVGLNLMTHERTQIRRVSRTMSSGEILKALDADPPEQPEWSRWMEHDPGSGKHIPLLTMKKEQVLAAVNQRKARTREENHRIALLELVAGRMKPGQIVGDVWTEDELTVIDQRITVRLKTSLRPMDDLLKGAAD